MVSFLKIFGYHLLLRIESTCEIKEIISREYALIIKKIL